MSNQKKRKISLNLKELSLFSMKLKKNNKYEPKNTITFADGIFGLFNFNNTCFINCIIQCLFSFQNFIEYYHKR